MTEPKYAELLETVDPVALGERIKHARKAALLTQADVANPVATAAYLSRLEDGQRRPSFAFLVHISTRLGVTMKYLLTGEDDMQHLPAELEEARKRVAHLEDQVNYLNSEMTEMRRRFARMEEALREANRV